jgi:hypothetical protein
MKRLHIEKKKKGQKNTGKRQKADTVEKKIWLKSI